MIDHRSIVELATGAVVAGTSSFIATNIDDVVVLMVLFARPNRELRDRQIIIGRYLGFGAIVLTSLLGFWGGLLLPKWAIGLLGFVPIAIGISQLRDRSSAETDQTDARSTVDRWIQTPAAQHPRGRRSKRWIPWFSPQAIQVAAITIACGADNIGIYVPLFAACNWLELTIILTVFFVGVGLLCWLARRFSRQRAIAQWISQFGHKIAPWVLIILGVWILWESEIFHFIIS